MALTLGPDPEAGESLEVLKAVYAEHRRRFDPTTDWCVRYFEDGVDQRGEPVELSDAEVGCPGC